MNRRVFLEAARPLASEADLTPLVERAARSRVVMLGEASHGTHEYYTWRARISRRLIEEYGFDFIAVEGDWPESREIDRFLHGDAAPSAAETLRVFTRWPTWMWANWEVATLMDRLRGSGASFYGLDVYSLWSSLEEILEHISHHHPEAHEHAEAVFRCFAPYNWDEQFYSWANSVLEKGCEDELIEILSHLQKVHALHEDPEEHFDAEMNAWAALHAERYYRTMMAGNAESWNLRDTYMADTLDRLLERHGRDSRAIVWAHNTHVGDARATDMAEAGMTNLGQIARERGHDCFIVGFGSHRGSVIASERWGGPVERKGVPPAQAGSLEAELESLGVGDCVLFTQDLGAAGLDRIGHRAIGVVYQPGRERYGNYVPTILGRRYDAFVFLSETQALHPLSLSPGDADEPPLTYPFAL